MTDALLEVKNLRVTLKGRGPSLVESLSFTLAPGECLGIAGESGSGKSLSLLALLGLLPPALCASGSARFQGEELLNAPESRLEAVRGRGIALIPQMSTEPFDPLCKVGELILEALATAFPKRPGAALKARILELFGLLRLPDPERIFSCYPHELSGGQQQRCLIAAALALEPRAIFADEPATALDAGNLRELVSLFEIVKARGSALVFISHDLALVRRLSDKVVVMQQGRVVESGPVSILDSPSHPYTRELFETRRALSRRFTEVMK